MNTVKGLRVVDESPAAPLEQSSAAAAQREFADDLEAFRKKSPALSTLAAAVSNARVATSQSLDRALSEHAAARVASAEAINAAARFATQLTSLETSLDAIGKQHPPALEAAREALRKHTEAGDETGAAAAAEKAAGLERSISEAQAKRRPIELRVEALRRMADSAAEQAVAAAEAELVARGQVEAARFAVVALERDVATCDAIALDAYVLTKWRYGGPGLTMITRGRVEYVVGESALLLKELERGSASPLYISGQYLDIISKGGVLRLN